MAFWETHARQVVTTVLVIVLVTGFALVGSAPSPESPISVVGTALVLLAVVGFISRGVSTFTTRHSEASSGEHAQAPTPQPPPPETDPYPELARRVRELELQNAALRTHLESTDGRIRQLHDDWRDQSEMLQEALSQLVDSIHSRGADADVYDVQWIRRR